MSVRLLSCCGIDGGDYSVESFRPIASTRVSQREFGGRADPLGLWQKPMVRKVTELALHGMVAIMEFALERTLTRKGTVVF